MARVAELADGRKLEFPDNTPDGVIDDTVRKVLAGTTADNFVKDPMPAYRQPESFLEGAARGAKESLRALPGTIGAIGGGLAGAPAGPVGMVAGAGLGYAGGEALARAGGRAIDAWQGYRRPTPPLLDQILQAGRDVAVGGALEMVPGVVKGAANRGKDMLYGLLGLNQASPADVAVRDAANRLRISLPASVASGSKPVAALEAVPQQFYLASQTAEPTIQRTRAQAVDATNRLGRSLGPNVGLEAAGQGVQRDVGALANAQENAATVIVDDFIATLGAPSQGRIGLGQSVQQGAKGVERGLRSHADELYASVREGYAGAEVPLRSLNETASRMTDLERRLAGVTNQRTARTAGGLQDTSAGAPAEPLRILDANGQRINPQNLTQEVIEQLGLNRAGARTLDETLEIQKRLRSLIRNTRDDYTKRQLGELLTGVTNDIEAFGAANGGQLGQRLREATNFYRQEIAGLFTEKSPLRKILNENPAGAADRILNTRNPSELETILRGLPPAQRTQVQRMVMERLRDRALDPRTGEVSAQRLEAAIQQYGDENLGILLGPRAAELQQARRTLGAMFGPGSANPALERVAGGNAATLVPGLTTGRLKSVENFDAVWQTVTPQTRQEVRGSLFADVLSQSRDPRTGEFSMERFLTAKNHVPQEIWDRMLVDAPDAAQALADVERVFQRFNLYGRWAANPSQTARAGLGASQALAAGTGLTSAGWNLASGDPESAGRSTALTLAALFSPALLGKAVYSQRGQRMFTSPAPQAGAPRTLIPGPIESLMRTLGLQLVPRQRDERDVIRPNQSPQRSGSALLQQILDAGAKGTGAPVIERQYPR